MGNRGPCLEIVNTLDPTVDMYPIRRSRIRQASRQNRNDGPGGKNHGLEYLVSDPRNITVRSAYPLID